VCLGLACLAFQQHIIKEKRSLRASRCRVYRAWHQNSQKEDKGRSKEERRSKEQVGHCLQERKGEGARGRQEEVEADIRVTSAC
jgi:hypothetical protein